MMFLDFCLIATAWASRPDPKSSCEADVSHRVAGIYQRGPAIGQDQVVAYLGVSDLEFRELVTHGRLTGRTPKLRPRVIAGTDALERFRANKRSLQFDVASLDEQLGHARLDAWSRSVLDVLNARCPGANFSSEAFLGFARLLGKDLDESANFSPSGAKIRRAAETSGIPKVPGNILPRLRRLANVMNVPWTLDLEDSGMVLRAIEAQFADLPSASGAVLSFGPSALRKMSWQERGEVHLKIIDLNDVLNIAPRSPGASKLLDAIRAGR